MFLSRKNPAHWGKWVATQYNPVDDGVQHTSWISGYTVCVGSVR